MIQKVILFLCSRFFFHHLLATVDKRGKKVIKKGDVTSILHSEEPRKKVMKKNHQFSKNHLFGTVSKRWWKGRKSRTLYWMCSRIYCSVRVYKVMHGLMLCTVSISWITDNHKKENVLLSILLFKFCNLTSTFHDLL